MNFPQIRFCIHQTILHHHRHRRRHRHHHCRRHIQVGRPSPVRPLSSVDERLSKPSAQNAFVIKSPSQTQKKKVCSFVFLFFVFLFFFFFVCVFFCLCFFFFFFFFFVFFSYWEKKLCSFLGADSQLYKRLRPSVCLSVGPSVRVSVHWSFCRSVRPSVSSSVHDDSMQTSTSSYRHKDGY